MIDARYKSMFIFPAVGLSALLLLISLAQIFLDSNQSTAWIGAAIAALPLLILMTQLMYTNVSRTSENLTSLFAIGSAGLVIALWRHYAVWQDFGLYLTNWFPTIVATLGFLIFTLYVYWYSRFERIASGLISVGVKLPPFALPDSNGDEFESSALAGSPAIMLFFRGNWCPLCMAQIEEIADRYKDIEALGIKVLLISPQPDESTRQLAEKFKVPFTFLVDAGAKLAEEWNIGVKNGVPVGMPGGYDADTVMPTLLMTNAAGTIIFSDQTDNYRVRPEPDVYLSILRRLGAVA